MDGYVRIDESLEYQYAQVPSVREFSKEYLFDAYTDSYPMSELVDVLPDGDSLGHVRGQLREAVGLIAAMFHSDAFVGYPEGGPQDATQFYAADFMIGKNSSVYYLRTVQEPILDGKFTLILEAYWCKDRRA